MPPVQPPGIIRVYHDPPSAHVGTRRVLGGPFALCTAPSPLQFCLIKPRPKIVEHVRQVSTTRIHAVCRPLTPAAISSLVPRSLSQKDFMKTLEALIDRLRRQARSFPKSAKEPSDIVSRLPLELHLGVLEFLEPDDVIAALDVCRSWRYVWLSDEIWPGLANRWLPGLSEHIRLAAPSGLEPGDAFRRALRINRRAVRGRFAHALRHSLLLESDKFFSLSKALPVEEGAVHAYSEVRDPDPDQDRFARFRLYSNGRIAWWPEVFALPWLAVVDDLRSRKRRVFLFPNRNEGTGHKASLGSQLLLMGRGRTLHAWHLERDTHMSVQIPYKLERCVTDGDTVLIASQEGHIYLWRYGGVLLQVDISVIPAYDLGKLRWNHPVEFTSSPLGAHRVGWRLLQTNTPVDFIVHPVLPTVFFVVILHRGHLAVHEFVEGKLHKSYQMADDLLSINVLERCHHLRWEKTDSHGGYNLLSMYPHPTGNFVQDHELDELCRDMACRCQTESWNPTAHTLISVCFNIYTKSFQVLRHHPKSTHPGTFHVWNQQLHSVGGFAGFETVHVNSPESSVNIAKSKLRNTVPLYTIEPTKRGDGIICTRRRKAPVIPAMLGDVFDNEPRFSHDRDFFLDASDSHGLGSGPDRGRGARLGPGSGPDLRRTHPEPSRLVGDDEFLIYFENNKFIAWVFGDAAVNSKRH